MKVVMRLVKTQVPSLQKFTESGEFLTDIAIMAGYQNYDAFVVGAAGGACGDALSKSNGRYRLYSCGGGGGGSLRLQGSLASLSATLPRVPVTVGAPGTVGVDGGQDAKAPNGGDGGDSSFGPHIGYGGKGAIGGDFTSTTYTRPTVNVDKVDVTTRAEGGMGGGNSAGLGVAGAGGKVAMYELPSNGVPVVTNEVAPVQGTWVNGGVAPVVGGGCGGGGGDGKSLADGSTEAPARAGNFGAFPDYYGAPGQNTTTDGGTGGGCDVHLVSGVMPQDHYGGLKPQGIVVIKLT